MCIYKYIYIYIDLDIYGLEKQINILHRSQKATQMNVS